MKAPEKECDLGYVLAVIVLLYARSTSETELKIAVLLVIAKGMAYNYVCEWKVIFFEILDYQRETFTI